MNETECKNGPEWTSPLRSGNEHDYMAVSLREGGVALAVQLGTGKLDTAIRPEGVRFDDNAWHRVEVRRKSSQVRERLQPRYSTACSRSSTLILH